MADFVEDQLPFIVIGIGLAVAMAVVLWSSGFQMIKPLCGFIPWC